MLTAGAASTSSLSPTSPGKTAALAQARQNAERRPALFKSEGGVLLQLPLTAA
jgi:hypothetical protein